MADIVAYEEGDAWAREAMRTGYPRFLRHPMIRQAASLVARERGGAEADWLLFASEKAAIESALLCSIPSDPVLISDSVIGLRLPDDIEMRRRGQRFLQHTGASLSSREAEDFLFQKGEIAFRHKEKLSLTGVSSLGASSTEVLSGVAGRVVKGKLSRIYGTDTDNIWLARGGMSAFWAGFKALQALQAERGRHRWVQLGWLYVDTMCILESFGDEPPVVFDDVHDLKELEAFLQAEGHTVAGIVTEVPTNPLVQTCEVARLRQLADVAGAALVLDPTLASPHNANVFPYCDLHINSLTKYAGSRGDTMIGAVAVNPISPFAGELAARIPKEIEAPGERDLARLAYQIDHYEETVQAINANTRTVAKYLAAHPAVRDVWWAEREESRANFQALWGEGDGPGAIVSFALKGDLASFYDRVRLAKGPSFGLQFTLLCPFLYLAHYDLVKSPQGRQRLQQAGIPPELVRLSVGMEPVEEIIGALAEALG